MILIEKIRHFNDERRTLRRILSTNNREAHILDVGCGRGRNLSLIREMGFSNVVGIDINPAMVKLCREQGFASYLNTEVSAWTRKWDVILMSHIVEHFEYRNLQDFVEGYLGYLQENGTLIISTPLPSDTFYNDFDHIKPYCPMGFQMAFGPSGEQIQAQGKWILKLEDLGFYRLPWRMQWHSTFYIPGRSRWPHFVNRLGRLAFFLSFGRLGSKAGWIGRFRVAGVRN